MATPPAVAAIWAIRPGPWLGAAIGGATALGGACWTAGWVGGGAGRGAGAAAIGADLQNRWMTKIRVKVLVVVDALLGQGSNDVIRRCGQTMSDKQAADSPL